jgi:hypothetical protein
MTQIDAQKTGIPKLNKSAKVDENLQREVTGHNNVGIMSGTSLNMPFYLMNAGEPITNNNYSVSLKTMFNNGGEMELIGSKNLNLNSANYNFEANNVELIAKKTDSNFKFATDLLFSRFKVANTPAYVKTDVEKQGDYYYYVLNEHEAGEEAKHSLFQMKLDVMGTTNELGRNKDKTNLKIFGHGSIQSTRDVYENPANGFPPPYDETKEHLNEGAADINAGIIINRTDKNENTGTVKKATLGGFAGQRALVKTGSTNDITISRGTLAGIMAERTISKSIDDERQNTLSIGGSYVHSDGPSFNINRLTGDLSANTMHSPNFGFKGRLGGELLIDNGEKETNYYGEVGIISKPFKGSNSKLQNVNMNTAVKFNKPFDKDWAVGIKEQIEF